MHDASKGMKKTAHFYGSGRVPGWLKKIRAKTLRTDEELSAFALSCRDSSLRRDVLSAVDRITDRDELLKIAASDADKSVRLRALERFPRDRAFLLAVKASAKHWSPSLSNLYPVESRAVELLKAQEADALAAAPDENAVAKLVSGGAVTESLSEAMRRITSESVLLDLLNRNVGPDVDAAVLGRSRHPDASCGADFQRAVTDLSLAGRFRGLESSVTGCLNDPKLLTEILDKTRNPALAASAADDLFWLYDLAKRSGTALPPLSDAQQDVLVRHLAGQNRLCRNHALGLLDPRHLKNLYAQVKDDEDRLEIVRRLPQNEFTDGLINDLLKMPGGRIRDQWERGLAGFSTERLIEIVRTHPDWRYRVKAMEFAVSRLLREENAMERIDAVVLPMIDEIRTENGHIGSMLVDIFHALPEELNSHFGFEPEYEEGETIDDAEWSTLKVRYGGHQYWVYYSQTDGGGYCPPYGEQIS